MPVKIFGVHLVVLEPIVSNSHCFITRHRVSFERRVESLLSVLTFGEKLSQLQTTHTGVALPGEGNSSNVGYITRLGLETYSTAECLHGVCDNANTTGASRPQCLKSFKVMRVGS